MFGSRVHLCSSSFVPFFMMRWLKVSRLLLLLSLADVCVLMCCVIVRALVCFCLCFFSSYLNPNHCVSLSLCLLCYVYFFLILFYCIFFSPLNPSPSPHQRFLAALHTLRMTDSRVFLPVRKAFIPKKKSKTTQKKVF